jgi:hypothetical protein
MPDQAPTPAGRRIALIAHDNKKQDMIEWAQYNLDLLAGHDLFATATTGHLLPERPVRRRPANRRPHRRGRDRPAGVLVGSARATSA